MKIICLSSSSIFVSLDSGKQWWKRNGWREGARDGSVGGECLWCGCRGNLFVTKHQHHLRFETSASSTLPLALEANVMGIRLLRKNSLINYHRYSKAFKVSFRYLMYSNDRCQPMTRQWTGAVCRLSLDVGLWSWFGEQWKWSLGLCVDTSRIYDNFSWLRLSWDLWRKSRRQKR